MASLKPLKTIHPNQIGLSPWHHVSNFSVEIARILSNGIICILDPVSKTALVFNTVHIQWVDRKFSIRIAYVFHSERTVASKCFTKTTVKMGEAKQKSLFAIGSNPVHCPNSIPHRDDSHDFFFIWFFT